MKATTSSINVLLAMPFALKGTSKDAIIRSLAAAVELAIDQVNNRTDILPNTHVNVVRVNTWDPAANPVWTASTSGGYALSQIADAMASMPVAGIIGDFFSRSTILTAEAATYYKKPFCGASQGTTVLSDKNNYPYFYRMQVAKGAGAHVLTLMKQWGISRIAMLQSADTLSASYATDIGGALSAAGISVTYIEISAAMEDSHDFSHTVSLIKSYDLRYIFLSAASDMINSFYGYAYKNNM
ncbi:hypothetical protein HK101_006905, partial [Irineochytrium annulatum]